MKLVAALVVLVSSSAALAMPAQSTNLLKIKKFGDVTCSNADRTVSIKVVRTHLAQGILTITQDEIDKIEELTNVDMKVLKSVQLSRSVTKGDEWTGPITSTSTAATVRIKSGETIDKKVNLICEKSEFNQID